ncbi:beta-N-acetylhexosaminidase [Plastorhodobacter daqingensis]|uniref:beta-N-acetylhexosaminidase n=1 Tax=Plastorhodobacter daqingensis TaxID=1387281 RepID=A0ABW2UH43_9RHOB
MPGATILGCAGLALGPEEAAFFREADPWGFILFARNIETPDQLRRLTADLRSTVGREAPVLIDQEGGRVQRLRPPHWRQWLPPLEALARAGGDPRAMWLRYRLIAAELHAVGVDVNCAPMADVAGAETHPFLRDRCYGETVAAVVAAARAAAEGLLAGGVLPVLKHIPGHGRATADSHLDLPVVAADAATLRSTDFAAFTALNDLPMAMTAHIVYAALDDLPATCSPRMMALLREEIGFDGLIMSDDISMQALSGTLGARSGAALAAGCDVVLHCNGNLAEMQEVAGASGNMTEAAATRADRALAARRPPEPVDIIALERELAALTGEQGHG